MCRAIRESNTELCLLLLEKGADINAKDHDGRTPLLLAILEDNIQLCFMLIEQGVE